MVDVAKIECDLLCAFVCEERNDLLEKSQNLGFEVAAGELNIDLAYSILRGYEDQIQGMYKLLYKADIIDLDEFDRLTDEAVIKYLNAFRRGFKDEKESAASGGNYKKC